MVRVNSANARSGMPSQVADTSHADQNFAPSTYNSPPASPTADKGDVHHGVRPLDQMSIPACPLGRPADGEYIHTAAEFPPVTRSTLRELDLNWIMHNISLRVDVNYDHDLHFMPIQGPDGEHKREQAKKYWLALTTEFRIYQHNLSPCPACVCRGGGGPVGFAPRLPTMFEALRELLETLVPDRDHLTIAENLDVPLLVQQVRKGVLDIVRLSRWIADLLKSHCAPMRDDWADEMAAKIEEGYLKADMDLIVDGLEKLFSFLEAMKLDVANHQIRTFRYPLIEDTVSFQQGYFGRKLRDGRIAAVASQHWYRTARDRHQKCQSSAGPPPPSAPLDALIHGILSHCTSPEQTATLPDTLSYDRLRIRQLQDDVQDMIHLDVCVGVFTRVCQAVGAPAATPAASTTLQWRLTTIIENDEAESRRESWQAHLQDVALEITRAAYVDRGPEHSPVPDDHAVERTTAELTRALTRAAAALADDLHARLETRTVAHAATFHKQSPLQISEAQRHWQQSRQDRKFWRADEEDVARRVAHIAVLHWKIWAGLVYLAGEGEDEDDAERGPTLPDGNRTNALNQMPVGSRELSRMTPDWTPSIDEMSTVNEGGGDLI